MAVLRAKDVAKMSKKEIEDKLKDLRIEMVKVKVGGGGKKTSKSNAKEIKKAVARLLTQNKKLNSEEGKNKEVEKK